MRSATVLVTFGDGMTVSFAIRRGPECYEVAPMVVHRDLGAVARSVVVAFAAKIGERGRHWSVQGAYSSLARFGLVEVNVLSDDCYEAQFTLRSAGAMVVSGKDAALEEVWRAAEDVMRAFADLASDNGITTKVRYEGVDPARSCAAGK